LKVDNCGISFGNDLKYVGEADTLTVNCPLSTINYLSFQRNDKSEFELLNKKLKENMYLGLAFLERYVIIS